MSISINNVILYGRLTRDAEERFTSNGKRILSFDIAHNKKWKSGGEWKEKVMYVRISTFNEYIKTKYLKKGNEVIVEGSLEMNEWDDKKTGERKRVLQISAFKVNTLANEEQTMSKIFEHEEIKEVEFEDIADNEHSITEKKDKDDIPF